MPKKQTPTIIVSLKNGASASERRRIVTAILGIKGVAGISTLEDRLTEAQTFVEGLIDARYLAKRIRESAKKK